MADSPLTPMDLTDHDRLVEMHSIVVRMDKTLFGNGQPGLIRDVERIEGGLKEARDDLEKFTLARVAEVRQETPGKGGQRFAQVTAAAAFVVAVIQGAAQVLGTK